MDALKPQDLVTALVLVIAKDEVPTYAVLGKTAGIAASEAHGAVRRLRKAGFVDAQRRVNRPALLEFLFHGLQRAFPATIGGPTKGVPTGAAAPCIDGFPDPEFGPWVWPSKEGSVRGLSLAPLYPSIPVSASTNDQVYKLLALTDLIRVGSAREVSHARRQLQQMLEGPRKAALAAALDVSSPHALQAIFSRQKVAYSIAKLSRESTPQAVVRHPLQKQILTEYKDDLSDLLSSIVPAESWAPEPGYNVVAEKGGGATRDLVYPSIIDTIVSLRVVDELEPSIRRGDGDRAFVATKHSSSRLPPGEYAEWWSEWNSYCASTAAAATQAGLALVVQTDIEAFFPSISRNMARQLLAQRTSAHSSVIGLLFHCLEAWLPRLPFLPGDGLPLDPHGVSGMVAHCLLKQVDEYFDDGYDLRYRRFVDDTVMFVDDRQRAEERFEQFRRELATIGLRPNSSKTSIIPTEQFQQERYEDVHQNIDDAIGSRSGNQLEEISGDWLRGYNEEEVGHVSVMRHLYTAHRLVGSDVLVSRALQDVEGNSCRNHALRYLRNCMLDATPIAELQRKYETSKYAGTRIEIARTIAEAPFSRSVDYRELAKWAIWQCKQTGTQPGDGYARGMLLLTVFKHGEQVHRDEIREWAAPSKLADHYLRLFFAYVFIAAGEFDPPLQAVLRHGGREDFALMMRLLDDASAARLRHLPRLLSMCRRYQRHHGRYAVSAEILPMLHILTASTACSSNVAKVLSGWLENTLKAGQRPIDHAICRHLESLQSRINDDSTASG